MGQYLSYPTQAPTQVDVQTPTPPSIQEMIKNNPQYGNNKFRPNDWTPCELCGRPVRNHDKRCKLHPNKKSPRN